MHCGALLLSLLAVVLLCAGSVKAGPVRQRLQKGNAFHVVVNADRAVRPADHRVMGISFFQLWNYLPIPASGSCETAPARLFRAFTCPSAVSTFSRLYWMDQSGPGRPSWDLKGSIDRAAEMCRRFGIEEEEFVLEPELQRHSNEMSPEKWVEAVRYAQSKGYNSR
jgi:hypothetical protein